MRLLSWDEFLAGEAGRPLSATVGAFDGLHLGHSALIGRVRAMAPSLASAVLTFRENPKKLLRPSSFRGDLDGLGQRLGGIEALGVDFCVLIDFSADFGTLSGIEFLSSLTGPGGVRHLVVGQDFRCGHRLDTDAEAIVRMCPAIGADAEILGPVMWSGHPVSSSRIRHAVTEGRMRDAASMLGRAYEIELAKPETVAAPIADGPSAREIAYPFAAGRVVPAPGVYEAEWRRPRVAGVPGRVRIGGGFAFGGASPDPGPESLAFFDMVSRE